MIIGKLVCCLPWKGYPEKYGDMLRVLTAINLQITYLILSVVWFIKYSRFLKNINSHNINFYIDFQKINNNSTIF